ncbi:hypothetical protein ACJJTC_013606 [Scirpophaga incertulas]
MKRILSFYSGRRQRRLSVVILLLLVSALLKAWWLSAVVSDVLIVPPPLVHDLGHFRYSRSLRHYLDNTQLLIEPSSTACDGAQKVFYMAIVSSAPSNVDQRAAIRRTWSARQPTFFVLGIDVTQDSLVDTYLEAKENRDMIVFDFSDHYQNLTLKTALMLHWAHRRCPQAGVVLKTDDDVLVNPWAMMDVLMLHEDKQLVGYKRTDARAHRSEYTKWYLPRWLLPYDTIREFLSGTGYVIQGAYIERILKAADSIPMINLEDVYFTYLVAQDYLGLTLTHEQKFSPYKPWLRTACAYWNLASVHSLSPQEMVDAWAMIEPLGLYYEGEVICKWSSFLSKDFFLY